MIWYMIWYNTLQYYIILYSLYYIIQYIHAHKDFHHGMDDHQPFIPFWLPKGVDELGKWGYPLDRWMVFVRENPLQILQIDDSWGYPHDYGIVAYIFFPCSLTVSWLLFIHISSLKIDQLNSRHLIHLHAVGFNSFTGRIRSSGRLHRNYSKLHGSKYKGGLNRSVQINIKLFQIPNYSKLHYVKVLAQWLNFAESPSFAPRCLRSDSERRRKPLECPVVKLQGNNC